MVGEVSQEQYDTHQYWQYWYIPDTLIYTLIYDSTIYIRKSRIDKAHQLDFLSFTVKWVFDYLTSSEDFSNMDHSVGKV